jgi:hypothetical protein
VCCSFARKNPDDRIEVNLDLDVLDATSAETKATYAEIKDYVLKQHGIKISNLYISQVKRKCEIEVGQNYNLAKSEDARQPQCPEEKEKVIMEALEHFRLV